MIRIFLLCIIINLCDSNLLADGGNSSTIEMAIVRLDTLAKLQEDLYRQYEIELAKRIKSNSAYFPKDPFESDIEFAERERQIQNEIIKLKQKYDCNCNKEIDSLKNTLYPVGTCEAIFNPLTYNSETQIWNIKLIEPKFFRDNYEINQFVPKEQARFFGENNRNVISTVYQCIDPGNVPALARVIISEPRSNSELVIEFPTLFQNTFGKESWETMHDISFVPTSDVILISAPKLERKNGMSSYPNNIYVFDLITKKSIANLEGKIIADISPDGDKLAIDGRIVNRNDSLLFDFTKVLDPVRAYDNDGYIKFSLDGNLIAVSNHNHLYIYSNDSFKKVLNLVSYKSQNIPDPRSDIYGIDFRPDSKYIVKAGTYSMSIYNLVNGKEEINIPYMNSNIQSVRYSYDGKFVYLLRNNTLDIFELKTKNIVRSYRCELFDLSRNNKQLAIYENGNLYLYSIASNKIIKSWKVGSPFKIIFSLDSRYIAIGDIYLSRILRTFY